MQRAGTLRYMGPSRPGPLLNRPRGDKCSEQGRPSQANRGPKNLGRSSGLQIVAVKDDVSYQDRWYGGACVEHKWGMRRMCRVAESVIGASLASLDWNAFSTC